MQTADSCPHPEQFPLHLANNVSGDDRTRFDDHVRRCPQCGKTAAGWQEAVSSSFESSGETLMTLASSGSLGPAPDASGASGVSQPPQAPAGGGQVFTPGDSLNTLRPGDRLDRYEIVGVLGRGGMGVVYKAIDTVLHRTVAVKTLGPLLTENPRARERFIREGRTAAAVRDQHVVTVYGVEGHQGTPFLILEYVDGKSLEDLLSKAAPLVVGEIVRLGAQIAQGLAAAHRKGLVHRDVKPANVLV